MTRVIRWTVRAVRRLDLAGKYIAPDVAGDRRFGRAVRMPRAMTAT